MATNNNAGINTIERAMLSRLIQTHGMISVLRELGKLSTSYTVQTGLDKLAREIQSNNLIRDRVKEVARG